MLLAKTRLRLLALSSVPLQMPAFEKQKCLIHLQGIRAGVKLARVVYRGRRLIESTIYLVYCYLINSS
jgi:hypothetical protein